MEITTENKMQRSNGLLAALIVLIILLILFFLGISEISIGGYQFNVPSQFGF